MIVLHVGLVKTGTTLLQHHVFAKTEAVTLAHRKFGRAANKLTRGMRTYTQTGATKSKTLGPRLAGLIETFPADGPPLIVSDENVALGPKRFWLGTAAPPAKVARRLRILARSLPPERAPVKLLLGVRRQDQWLGSCYAEASEQFPEFGQADFERRMAEIAAAPADDPRFAWLDYHAVAQTLRAAFRPENVLIVSLERLTTAPAAALGDIAALCGGADLLGTRDAAAAVKKPSNQLSGGANVWKLRRDGSSVHLPDDIGAAIRERYATSNAALDEETPLDFAA